MKSLLYPPKSRAKPDALYVDRLLSNAVFQFETLFVFLFRIFPAASHWCLSVCFVLVIFMTISTSKVKITMAYISPHEAK